MNTVPSKIVVPLEIEELEARNGRHVEIMIKDPELLTELFVHYAARLQENGHMKLHCFYIDERWLLEEDKYTWEGPGGTWTSGGGHYDARHYILHPQLELFRFMGVPVYLIDEVNSGQYDIHTSGMGWVGILAVPG